MTQVKLISVKTVKQLRNMLACLGGKREKDEGSLLWYRLERRRYKCTCYVAVMHPPTTSLLFIYPATEVEHDWELCVLCELVLTV